MIDLLSLHVLFSHFTPCDWFSREQFLSTCTCINALFIKRQKANSFEDITIIVQAEKVYFAGRECFSAVQGRSAGAFCREEIIDELRVKTKLLRAKFRQLFSVIHSTETLSPHYNTLPHSPKSLCVLEGGGARHTLVQAIQSGFSTEYLAAQRFRICAPINEGGSLQHSFVTELCVA